MPSEGIAVELGDLYLFFKSDKLLKAQEMTRLDSVLAKFLALIK